MGDGEEIQLPTTWESKASLWRRDPRGPLGIQYIRDIQEKTHFLADDDSGNKVRWVTLDSSRGIKPCDLITVDDVAELRNGDAASLPAFLYVEVCHLQASFSISGSMLYELVRSLNIPLYYVDMMAKSRAVAEKNLACVPQPDMYFRAGPEVPLTTGTTVSKSLSTAFHVHRLYYSLYVCGIAVTEAKSKPPIGILAIYYQRFNPGPSPLWFIASTRELSLVELFLGWMARSGSDFENGGSSAQIHALHLFLCEISCMNWDAALDYLEMEIGETQALVNTRPSAVGAPTGHIGETTSKLRSFSDDVDRIAEHIERNVTVIRWLLDIYTDKRNQVIPLGFISLLVERIQEVMEEYNNFLKRAEHLAEKLNKFQGRMTVLSANDNAEKLQWTILQVLKINFIMRNFVSTMGFVLILTLPGIFTSTLFSTSFFDFDEYGNLVISSNIWIWFAIVVPLSTMIITLQRFWYHKASGTRPKRFTFRAWLLKRPLVAGPVEDGHATPSRAAYQQDLV